jgi:hypothetical protein
MFWRDPVIEGFTVWSCCLLLQYLIQSCARGDGTHEEPGTLTQGVPVFPGCSRLGIEPWREPDGVERREPATGGQGDFGLWSQVTLKVRVYD